MVKSPQWHLGVHQGANAPSKFPPTYSLESPSALYNQNSFVRNALNCIGVEQLLINRIFGGLWLLGIPFAKDMGCAVGHGVVG